MLWLGLVLGISWMEAPVKFRSPLLEKPAMLWLTLFSLSAGKMLSDTILLWLSTMLAVQISILTPSLVRIGKARVVKDLDRDSLKGSRKEYYDKLQEEVSVFGSLPPRSLHAVYVVMELIKVILLPVYAFQIFSASDTLLQH